MKKIAAILFLLFSIVCFSQKKATQKFQTQSQEIEISTIGLDDFVLENSDSGFIEITLFTENPHKQHIIFKEANKITTIEFSFNEIKNEETVFRKFITKRLERANAVIKIPKGKKATILGRNINIETKNYKGPIDISIEKGILKLNEIKENTSVKLYAGTIFASLKNTNINVVSNIGKIKFDENFYEREYQNLSEKNQKSFTVKSINANVFLTSINTK